MRAPFIYYGGKSYLKKEIIALMPYHRIYVEVFGGAGNVLLNKPVCPVEVYNDINENLVNVFRVIKDSEDFKEFHRQLALTPYSREEFLYASDIYKQSINSVEKAYCFYILSGMSFTGQGKTWGYAVSLSRRNMAGRNSAWLSNIEELSKIHNRLKNVIIENKDFREVIRDYDSEETLFYLDPPYILDTRRTGKKYTYEMTDEDYEDLIKILLGVKGNVILSNYKDPRFIELEKNGWQRKDIKKAFSCVNARNTKTKGYRIESIWLKIGGVK